MKANMTHQPQEVLIKVMCSERLPSKEGKYIADLWLMNFYPDIDRWYRDGEPYSPEYWYEPATRIVLTEEEYSGICMKQYDEGYSDATKEARDEIANNYRPNDN